MEDVILVNVNDVADIVAKVTSEFVLTACPTFPSNVDTLVENDELGATNDSDKLVAVNDLINVAFAPNAPDISVAICADADITFSEFNLVLTLASV